MKVTQSSSVILVVAGLVIGGWFGGNIWKSAHAAGMAPPSSIIPTFSTANIGRQGHFYVGGDYVEVSDHPTMDGAKYV